MRLRNIFAVVVGIAILVALWTGWRPAGLSDPERSPPPAKPAPAKTKTKKAKKAAPRPKKTSPKPSKAPDGKKEVPKVPHVVVTSKAGAALASTYLVKGKVTNEGGKTARGLRVDLTLLAADQSEIARVEAKCKTEVEPGETVRFEGAYLGERLDAIDTIKVEVDWEGKPGD